MATVNPAIAEDDQEFRMFANPVPDNTVSCYTFMFGAEQRQASNFCSVYSNSRELLMKFSKSESNDLCRYITKLGRTPPLTQADSSLQLLRTDSTDTNYSEEEGNDGHPLSVTVHQCALSDFYLDPPPSEFEADSESPVAVNVCKQVVSCIVNLRHLVELTLANCDFSDLDEEIIVFGEAPNLELLNVDSMNLRRLHPSVGRLRNLRLLSVQYNRLCDFPLTLRLLRKLEYLNVTGNPLTTIPCAVFHLPNILVLEGLNFCPLQKNSSDRWNKEKWNVSWCPPLLTPRPREEVESLQDVCSRRAVGMDCWAISLPERHRRVLAERAFTYDLCQKCLRPVKKLTSKHETDGYSIRVILEVFCGQRNVPFNFIACSEVCKNSVVQWLMELQTNIERMYRNCYLPRCTYSLQYVQDLPEVQQNRKRRIQVTIENSCYK